MFTIARSWVLPYIAPNIQEMEEDKLVCVDCGLNCSRLCKGGICPDCIKKKPKKYFLPYGYPSAAIYRRVLREKARISLFLALRNSSRQNSPRKYFEKLFAAFHLFARLEQIMFSFSTRYYLEVVCYLLVETTWNLLVENFDPVFMIVLFCFNCRSKGDFGGFAVPGMAEGLKIFLNGCYGSVASAFASIFCMTRRVNDGKRRFFCLANQLMDILLTYYKGDLIFIGMSHPLNFTGSRVHIVIYLIQTTSLKF